MRKTIETLQNDWYKKQFCDALHLVIWNIPTNSKYKPTPIFISRLIGIRFVLVQVEILILIACIGTVQANNTTKFSKYSLCSYLVLSFDTKVLYAFIYFYLFPPLHIWPHICFQSKCPNNPNFISYLLSHFFVIYLFINPVNPLIIWVKISLK